MCLTFLGVTYSPINENRRKCNTELQGVSSVLVSLTTGMYLPKRGSIALGSFPDPVAFLTRNVELSCPLMSFFQAELLSFLALCGFLGGGQVG